MYRKTIIDSGLAYVDEIVGCTSGEIEEVAASLNIRELPVQYAEFLRQIGKGAGIFRLNSSLFFPECIETRSIVREVLDLKSFVLPSYYIPFYQHEGYEFYFMDIKTSDSDPKIIYINDSYAELIQDQSFTEFFNRLVSEDVNAWRRLDPGRLDRRMAARGD